MISWIQNHLIRHGRWIFLSLLALIIVAFVFTIGNTPGCTSDQSGYQAQNFYNIDMNSPRERDPIVAKTSLSIYLNGQQIRNDQQFQSEVMSRIAMLHLADQIGIPTPDSTELTEYIKSKSAFSGPDGSFSSDNYTRFLDSLESNPQMSKERLARTLEDDYRIDQVGGVAAGPGYSLPSAAQAQAQTRQTELSITTAEISYDEFKPELTSSPAEIKAYFEANKLSYEIPERINASYISFPIQAVEADEAELRQHFISQRQRFVKAYQAKQNATETSAIATEVTFEQVSEAVSADWVIVAGQRAANEAAQAFAYNLYSNEIKRESAAFNQLLNESGLTLTAIPPYTTRDAAGSVLSPQMLASAFALNESRYYSDGYAVENGFAVLIYQGRIAPEIPQFETVASTVRAEFLAQQKRARFNENGIKLKGELEAELALGAEFSSSATALGLAVNSFDSFKATQAPQELNRSALQTAQRMQAGEVSSMLNLQGTGTFVYLKAKNTPIIGPEDDDFTQAQEFLSYVSTTVSAGALVNELVAGGLPTTAANPE